MLKINSNKFQKNPYHLNSPHPKSPPKQIITLLPTRFPHFPQKPPTPTFIPSQTDFHGTVLKQKQINFKYPQIFMGSLFGLLKLINVEQLIF